MDAALAKLKIIGAAMDPSSRRSPEWKAMKQAFTKPDPHLSKEQQLQFAHECVTKYMKDKKSLRSNAEEQDRFDQSLDALAVLSEVGPLAKAKTSVLQDRINYVRTHRPLAWQKNQPTVSNEEMASRAESVDRNYGMKYKSVAERALQKGGQNGKKKVPTGADFLAMGGENNKEAAKLLPQNDDLLNISDTEPIVNAVGYMRANDTKAEYLANMLALEKTPAFRNHVDQVCISLKEYKKQAELIAAEPGFDRFAKQFDDRKIEEMKQGGDHGKNLEEIQDQYRKFKNPELADGGPGL